jgi:ABC-2 type transport system permease protein
MGKLFAIVRREFIERVRTKAFLFGTFAGPLLFAGIGLVATSMFGAPTEEQPIAVIDATAAKVGLRLTDSLGRERVGQGEQSVARYRFSFVTVDEARLIATRDSLLRLVDRRVGGGELAADGLVGVLIITDSGLTAGRLTYLGSNVSNLQEIQHFERGLRVAVVRERVRSLGLSEEVATAATSRVELTTGKVSKGALTGQGSEGAFMFSYALVILLFLAMLPTGIQVMAAVVEEKSNRILEVLVSSVKPFDLMLGKVLGVGGASLLQIAIWGASASGLSLVLGGGGKSLAQTQVQAATEGSANAAFSFPTIAPDLIVITLLYFALGFLFFSTAYAAVGAMCNTVQETQQVAMPVTMMVMAGYLGSFLAIARPGTTLAKVMTYLPFTAPFIVPTRWSNAPLPLSELLGSITFCLAGVVGMVWLAAKIYRVGILSHGKKPSFKDLWLWIREG